jgi:hypothetical protein
MTTIFTILVCMTFPNPADAKYNGRCGPPDSGLEYFQSEAECKKMADYYAKIDADPANGYTGAGAVRQEWKCFKKAVNTWQPAS